MGVEGLALAGIHGHHGATQGRIDAGVAEFGLVAAQPGAGLANLGFQATHPGGAGIQLRLGALHVLRTGGVAAGQLQLAAMLLAGEGLQGALLGELRLEGIDLRMACFDAGLLGRWIDLHQQLPGLNLAAGLDVQSQDLPGRLGADIDVAPRLQGAEGGHLALDVGTADHHRRAILASAREQRPGREGAKTHDCRQGQGEGGMAKGGHGAS
ncbi:hypothetical protein Q3H58_004874 [Pseudomonas psychrotolerans]|nr:hypothetical protein [Pseudomonas psychrotolerans]